MSPFQQLLELPEEEKKALGISATAGEIAQQPQTWRRTRAILEEHADALKAFLEMAGVRDSVNERPTILLTGAGTSDYIGQALALLLRVEWQCETLAIPSTDLLVNLPNYLIEGQRFLVVSFSRSGDSPEGVAVLDQLLHHYPSIAHIVVTCNAGGKMATIVREHPQNAYCIVLDDAVNDRGLAMTSSFTNMVITGQCLAHLWKPEVYAGIFENLVSAGDRFLPHAAACAEELARTSFPRVCTLGSGALTAVARESALKILEMTAGRVKTMSESVLGLRHGPMSALDERTLLICFASSEERRQRYEADLLREVGNKGIVAQRIVVGPADNAVFAGCSEHYLGLSAAVPDLYRPPVDILLGQLLGLYFSLAQNLKPDAPSPRGIISRVVGEFKIYA